jgi:MFS family permease
MPSEQEYEEQQATLLQQEQEQEQEAFLVCNDEPLNYVQANHSLLNKEKDIAIPYIACGKVLKINQNVFLYLVCSVLFGLSDSIWSGSGINTAYLQKLGKDRNGPVGVIEAVYGLSSLLVAFPVGYLADHFGRSKVIRAGAKLMLATIVIQMYFLEWIGTSTDESAVELSHKTAGLWIMGGIMACWGVADVFVDGPLIALFADSTPEGQRSTFYTYSFACYTLAASVGPLVDIFLFQTIGDEWDLYHLRIIVYVGLAIGVVYCILMLFFDDAKALEETITPITDDSHQDEIARGQEEEQCHETPILLTPTPTPSSTTTMMPSSLESRRRWIPYIIFIQAFILAAGSGMTDEFFPLFFKDEAGMSPSQVQIVYVAVPIVTVLLSGCLSRLANSGVGRVQATLLFSCFGVVLLYSMVLFKSFFDHHPFLLKTINILRTGLMDCFYPLQESILMDSVPKHERARWKSLDAVVLFAWSGSCALGGFLTDRYDYFFTFLITAVTQTIGVAFWLLLLPLVPRNEGHDEEETADGGLDRDSVRTLIGLTIESSHHGAHEGKQKLETSVEMTALRT